MPTPAGPLRSIARARPWVASSRTAASRAKASSRPTYRALVYRPGMTILGRGPQPEDPGRGARGAAPGASARLGGDDRWPRGSPPRQHAQRAERRGVALLHEVGAHDGLPVGARARRPQGARSEQAAAPDGPPHRVLHPDRRARPRPVRGRRRDAARGGHRARPASGPRHRAGAALGRHLRDGSCSSSPPSATAPGRSSPTSGRRTRAGRAASTRPAASCASATRWRSCRRLPEASVDFVATDPPYNVQLPLTMAGGKLAETHANRRTDYAMVTDSPADLANAPDYPTFLDRMGEAFGEIGPRPAAGPLRDGHRARCLPGRSLPVHRRRPRRARVGGRPRAQGRPRSGTRPGRGSDRTAIRARSSRTSRTSTSSCCAGSRRAVSRCG